MLYKKKEVAKAASENRLILFYLGLQRLMRQALFFLFLHDSTSQWRQNCHYCFTKNSLNFH